MFYRFRLYGVVFAFVVCIGWSFYAVPGEQADSTGADIAYGEYLSGECVTCHAASAESQAIPSITGWDPVVFADVLYAYKKQELENPVMRVIAKRLDDAQIASLAVYFASLPEQDAL